MTSALAGLAMIVARLQLTARVLKGEADPEWLLTPQNAIPKFAEAASAGDALLKCWTDLKRAEVAAAEAERIWRRTRKAKDR